MGYISAVRDENSGYRYYDDDGIFGVLNAKMHVKYGFSHEQIAKMQHFSLEQSIEAYKERMDEMDRQIAYMTYLRHRLKDDYVLMNKAAVNSDIYEKNSLDLRYVLYKYGEKLLQEPERLLQVKEFLYNSPELQHIYMIPKEEIEEGRFTICCGIAVKEGHVEKYSLKTNDYARHYTAKPSVMGISRIPAKLSIMSEKSDDEVRQIMIGKHITYMKEHNLKVAGDVTGIVISKAYEDEEEVLYVLMCVPVTGK